MLEILANSDKIDVIQLHLKTIFDGIVRLDINDEDIKAMRSKEGEVVEIKKPLKRKGAVESWLFAT